MHLRLVKIKMLLLLGYMPSNYLTSVFVDSGNETNECPSAHMFHLLLQSLVRMKVTVDDGTEGFSVSVSHEATGTCSPESHLLVLLQLNSRIALALAILHYILYSHVVTISM
jgi:hypothetical protein